MPVAARLIDDEPQPGNWNMSVDQALLDLCEQTPVLRFYQWSEPTLSLGYFQKHVQRESHLDSRDCPMLRRSTGGGAILHDQELTYSLQVPVALVPKRSADLYDVVHDAFCDWLQSVSVDAHPFTPSLIGSMDQVDGKAFLCFQRRADGDVVAWEPTEKSSGNHTGSEVADPTEAFPSYTSPGHKLLGSAQRKQKNALLQHGSILLKRSHQAPQLPGVLDMPGYSGPTDITEVTDQIRQHLQQAIASACDWDFAASEVSETERQRAEFWLAERFTNATWNQSR